MTARNQPCTCGSGRRYKHCCGGLAAVAPVQEGSKYDRNGYYTEPYRREGMASECTDMPPGRAASSGWIPPGLLVVENFLDSATAREWRGYFEGQESRRATIRDATRRNPDGSPAFRPDKGRITDFVPMGELESEIQATLKNAYTDTIAPYFGREIDWMTYPTVLKYRAGGLYKTHADSEHWDKHARRWVRGLDRDFSLLLYVNDDYEGGTLYFPNFDFRLTPGAGMLVAFPSDHRYMHAAETLVSGERFALVSWAAARGVPRLNPLPPGAVTF